MLFPRGGLAYNILVTISVVTPGAVCEGGGGGYKPCYMLHAYITQALVARTYQAPFSNFLFTNLFSIKFLYFLIISSLFPYFNLFVSIFIRGLFTD